MLSGTIPKVMGRSGSGTLRKLKKLDLSGNDLRGAIPPSIGIACRDLMELNLTGNKLSGGVPVELLMLSNLTALGLHGNMLLIQTFPKTIGAGLCLVREDRFQKCDGSNVRKN
jgi:Leucine-rich repeat (LRR) protein